MAHVLIKERSSCVEVIGAKYLVISAHGHRLIRCKF